MIGIEGSIQTRKYTDKDGNNRTAFEVVANNVQFVESKKTADVSVDSANDPLNNLRDRLQDAGLEVSSDDDLPF